MGDRTGIQWTDATWNPVSGCSKVSQGCKFCYAEKLFPRPYPGRKFTDVRCHPERLEQPLRWARPRRIFVNSMSDLFHEDVPFEFIDKVFAVMSATDRHTFQILTKRPERMLAWFERLTPDPHFGIEAGAEQVTNQKVELRGKPQHNKRRGGYDNCGLDWPLRNVWLGVSVEDQETANERIPLLLRTPAAVRFLSCEPLLGPLDLRALFHSCSTHDFAGGFCIQDCGDWQRLHWIIVGGESGAKARPFTLGHGKDIVRQCRDAGVPVFVKQVGSNPVNREGQRCPHVTDRKGGNPDEWPEELRVREFPRSAQR